VNAKAVGIRVKFLILLIDRECTCACEDFVMPFKATHRAELIGETTDGLAQVQRVVADGLLLMPVVGAAPDVSGAGAAGSGVAGEALAGGGAEGRGVAGATFGGGGAAGSGVAAEALAGAGAEDRGIAGDAFTGAGVWAKGVAAPAFTGEGVPLNGVAAAAFAGGGDSPGVTLWTGESAVAEPESP
jgi:hypothetical protein